MKKKKGPVSPSEALENLMKNIPLENEADIMKMLNSIMQPGEYEQHMNKQFFRSNHKDYASMCKPLNETMLPFFQARQPRDVVNAYNDILDKMKPMTQEVREAEVRNFLLNLLAEKDKRMDDPSTSCLYLYGILAVMEHYDITSAADLLIELLCQDMFFYAYYFNGYEDTAALAYSKLCRNALDNLKTYMLETGHIPDMKWIVLDAVTYRAVMHPEDRLAVVSFLSGVLGEMVKMQNVYEITVERLIYCLACLRATEALPIIERAMNHFQIPGLFISDGFKGVKSLMKSGCTLINEITDNSVEEMLITVADYADNHPDDSDEEDMDFPFGFDEEDDDFYGNDILADWLVDDVNHVKDYHLSVKLLNAPIPVTRELVVPNNIDMLAFENVLIMAMGWNGSHLSQFHKGGNFYMREDFLDDDFNSGNCEELDCLPLVDFLARKGSSMIWEYDFGDSWEHEIKVTAVTSHETYAPYEVKLLAAENACPPEDCGGVWGYQHLLEVLADKKHPEYKEMKAWVGRGFNPNKFNISKVQKQIEKHLQDFEY